MPNISYSINAQAAVEGFEAIRKAAKQLTDTVHETSAAFERTEKGIAKTAALSGRETAFTDIRRQVLADRQRLADTSIQREERLAAVVQESDRDRHRKLLQLIQATTAAEADAIRRNDELGRRLAQQLQAEKIRTIKEISAAEANALQERERTRQALVSAQQRVETFVDPTIAVKQKAIELEKDFQILRQSGAISEVRLNELRKEAAIRLENMAVAARRAHAAQSGLHTATAQLSRSFAVLAFGPLSGVGARLITFQVLAENLSGVIGAGGAGTLARVGLIGRVVGLGLAFAGLGTGLLLAQRAIRTALDFQNIESTFRVASGSAEGAARSLRFVREEADRLGLPLVEASRQFARLEAATRGTQLAGGRTQEIFSSLAEASTVLGLSVDQFGGILNAVVQIVSKGTVQAEELRGQLGERLPGAFQLAANAMGKTTEELGKMLERGDVLAVELLPALAEELRRTFGPFAEGASRNLRAELNRLQNTFLELFETIGESGFITSFTNAVKDLNETFKDPAAQDGLGFYLSGIGKLAELAARNIGNIAAFGAAVSAAFLAFRLGAGGPGAAIAFAAAAGLSVLGKRALRAAGEVVQLEDAVEDLERAIKNLRDVESPEFPELPVVVRAGEGSPDKFIELAVAVDQAERAVESLSRRAADTEVPFVDIFGAKEELAQAQAALKAAREELEKAGISAAEAKLLVRGAFGETAQDAFKAEEAVRKLRLELDEDFALRENLKAANAVLDRFVELTGRSAEVSDLRALVREAYDPIAIAARKAAEAQGQALETYLEFTAQLRRDQGANLARLSVFEQSISLEETERNLEALDKQVRKSELLQEATESLSAATLDLSEEAFQSLRQSIAENIDILVEQEFELRKAEEAYEDLRKAAEDAQRQIERENQRATEAFFKPFEEAAENVQELFADTFEDILNGTIRSFSDLAEAVKNIMFRMAAEVTTLLIFKPVLLSLAGASEAGGLGRFGALLGGGDGGGAAGAGLKALADIDIGGSTPGQRRLREVQEKQLVAMNQIQERLTGAASDQPATLEEGIFADTGPGVAIERRRQEIAEAQTKQLSGIGGAISKLGDFFLGGRLPEAFQEGLESWSTKIFGPARGSAFASTFGSTLGLLGPAITGAGAAGLILLGSKDASVGTTVGTLIGGIAGAIGGSFLGATGIGATLGSAVGGAFGPLADRAFSNAGISGGQDLAAAGAALNFFQSIPFLNLLTGPLGNVAGGVLTGLGSRQAGVGVGTSIGAGILSAIVPFGGSLLSGLVVGAFDDPEFKAVVQTVSKDTAEDMQDQFLGGLEATSESILGITGVVFSGIRGVGAGDVRASNFALQFLDSIANVQNQIALKLTAADRELVGEALRDFGRVAADRKSVVRTFNNLLGTQLLVAVESLFGEPTGVLQQSDPRIRRLFQVQGAPFKSSEFVQKQLEQVLTFLDERQEFVNALTELRVLAGLDQPITQIEQGLEQINQLSISLQTFGEQFGVDITGLSEITQKALQAARDAVGQQSRLELLGTLDPLTSALRQIAEQEADRIREAQAANQSILEVEVLFGIRRLQAIENANRGILQFIEQQTLTPAAATLPSVRIEENLEQFNLLLERVRAGTEGASGRTDIVRIAQNLVGALEEQFAFTEPFFEQRNEILNALREITGTSEDGTAQTNEILRNVGIELARGNAVSAELLESVLAELQNIRSANEALIALTKSGHLQQQEARP